MFGNFPAQSCYFGGIRTPPVADSPFHAVDRGSNPLGDAKRKIRHLHKNVSAFFFWGDNLIANHRVFGTTVLPCNPRERRDTSRYRAHDAPSPPSPAASSPFCGNPLSEHFPFGSFCDASHTACRLDAALPSRVLAISTCFVPDENGVMTVERHENWARIVRELSAIGNTRNQIARHINSRKEYSESIFI